MEINNINELCSKYHIDSKIIGYLDNLHQSQGAEAGYLTELQKEVFSDNNFWDDSQNVIIQGRTSSGKTLLAQIATAYFGGKEADISSSSSCARKKVIYLVPLRAMVNEKKEDFKKIFTNTLGWRVYASSSDYQDHDSDIVESNYEVAIIVYEKFFALLTQTNDFIKNCGLIVVDELQMMNDDSRGPKLEISLTKVLIHNQSCKIIGLTTTQCDVEQIRSWLNTKLITNTCRPKALEEYVVWPSESGTCLNYYVREEDTNGNFDTSNEPIKQSIALDDNQVPLNNNDRHIEEKTLPYLIEEIRRENGNKTPKTIIFINNRALTQTIARELCNHLPLKENFTQDLDDVRIQNSVFSEDEYASILINDLLPYGVAFHHGGLSWSLREYIEDEFRKFDGMIDIVIATETLAIGVNMPADVVVLLGIASPRNKDFKAEMVSHEYKNYVGRAGRLGSSSAEKGKSYLIAPTKEKANDYWNRYLNAKKVNITSALRRLTLKEQTPFFFNLVDTDVTINNCFDVDIFNEHIQKTMAYCSTIEKGALPGASFINYLVEAELIEAEEDTNDKYTITRIGKELVSYALNLDSINKIKNLCEKLAQAAREELNYDDTNDEPVERKTIIDFIEKHQLDILFVISKCPELSSVFVNNIDEMYYTNKALNFARTQKDNLLEDLSLWKILDKFFEQKMPMPNYNNSFALKRAICMFEWVKGKDLNEIKGSTGLSYISFGDLDRLGDVFAYIWEAMTRVLIVQLYKWENYKTLLVRFSGRFKYGVNEELIFLASRHVQYVTRKQLIELKKEAKKLKLTVEQYVRLPYDLLSQNNQILILRREQHEAFAKELDEHYGFNFISTIKEAAKLKRDDILDIYSYEAVKEIDEKRIITKQNIKKLLCYPRCNIQLSESGTCMTFSFNEKRLHIHIPNVSDSNSFNTYLKLNKIENTNQGNVFIINTESFKAFGKYQNDQFIFISPNAFVRLYLLSLKLTSSLEAFFNSLYCGYFSIPEDTEQLEKYIRKFIPDNRSVNSITLESSNAQRVVMYVIDDEMYNPMLVEVFNCLSKKFDSKSFDVKRAVWSDTLYGYYSRIVEDENANILVFIDENFDNMRFIKVVIPHLFDLTHERKVFMLYKNDNVKSDFLKKNRLFEHLVGISLGDNSTESIAEEAYRALKGDDNYEHI